MPYNQTKTITPDLAVTLSAYTIGDVVGGLITINVSGGAATGGGGVLRRLMLVDDADQKEPYTLYLFDQKPGVIANDDAFAPTVADLKKMIAKVSIAAGDYVTLNGNAIAIKEQLEIDYTCVEGYLYGYLVAVDTPDYAAAADLTLRLTVWAD